jgi:MinD-like ATPase involved in chromosome partitioning or flagellar assembly
MIEPVPTSLENAFIFLKNLVYRHILRIFYTDKPTSQLILSRISDKKTNSENTIDDLLEIIQKRSAEKTQQFIAFLSSLNNIYLVLNRLKSNEQYAIIDRFARIIKRYLHITCHCGGSLPDESKIDESIIARTPLLVKLPDCNYGKDMEKIIENLF